MDDPKQPSGFVLAKSPTRAEILTIAVIILGAAAEMADVLPVKIQGILLALWAIVRVVIRTTGQAATIREAETLGKELKEDVAVYKAKKAVRR